MYDYNKPTWFNDDIEYLFDSEIIEYDIHDAGFSLIKQFNLLPDFKIKELEGLERGVKRHIAVGKLQRDDKEFSKALSSKFAEARRVFLDLNNLTDSDIISVKKDALFVLRKCNRLKFGLVEYVPKHTYTSYIRFPNIQNLELYYSDDGLDIKGMNDTCINKHRLYMMEYIRSWIHQMETHNARVKRDLLSFIDSYKSGELEDAYYLEFNSSSRSLNPVFNLQNVLVPLVEILLKEMQ